MNEILFKDLKVVHLRKKNLKNSYISVRQKQEHSSLDVEILLKTPHISTQILQEILQEKEAWIRLQISKLLQNPPKQIRLEDEVELFGEIYSIDSSLAQDLSARLTKVQTNNQEKILQCYDAFYKQISLQYLGERTAYFADKMELIYQELKYRKMKSRWGSCSSHKVITLNTQLIKIDKTLIDYVIVHELAHLVHMNHSKAFHDLVASYIPDAKLRRKKLKTITLL